jgi:hypothetical protein
MVDGFPSWSLRSALVSVSDLERSTRFYQEVMGIDEAYRQDQLTVIGLSNSHCTVYLRQVSRGGLREGEQALGLRALFITVGSFRELDQVEEALRDHDSFRDRPVLDEVVRLEAVRGFDPDRLPLVFVAQEPSAELSPADIPRVANFMYAIDI